MESSFLDFNGGELLWLVVSLSLHLREYVFQTHASNCHLKRLKRPLRGRFNPPQRKLECFADSESTRE